MEKYINIQYESWIGLDELKSVLGIRPAIGSWLAPAHIVRGTAIMGRLEDLCLRRTSQHHTIQLSAKLQ